VRTIVLPRDLTVVVHEDHKAPVVAVDIWYHAGSADEVPGKTVALAERHEFPPMRMTMIEDGPKQLDLGPVQLLDTDGRVLP